VLAPNLLKGKDTIWDVDLAVARSLIFDDGHNWNAISVCFRDFAGSFLGVITVDLDQMSPCFELSLDKIVELIYLLLLLLLLAVLLLLAILLLLVIHCESICHNIIVNIFILIISNK
jgi:hypothetical protein